MAREEARVSAVAGTSRLGCMNRFSLRSHEPEASANRPLPAMARTVKAARITEPLASQFSFCERISREMPKKEASRRH